MAFRFLLISRQADKILFCPDMYTYVCFERAWSNKVRKSRDRGASGWRGSEGKRRRKMEIRVNTGPSSLRENKGSVIWEFSSGASIDNNLAQPYIQRKYNANLSFATPVPFSRTGTLSTSVSICQPYVSTVDQWWMALGNWLKRVAQLFSR